MQPLESLAIDGERARTFPSLTLHGARLQLARPLAATLGALAVFCACVSAAGRGVVPGWAAGASITASYVALVASVFELGQALGPWAVDETGAARGLLRRHGFWIAVLCGLLYLPTLGLSSLWDPWETHYGEVAREILVRHDWISFWWSHQGFFYSKPALLMWVEAAALAVFRVDVRPGHVLLGDAHPEWVVRLPNVAFAVVGLYVLYRGAAKAFGRRAAFFGAAVLATCPHWFLLAHQATTDMTFVAPMSAAVGLLLLGLHTAKAETARAYPVRVGKWTLEISAWHVCIGAIVGCAVPQALYLLSRNVDFVWEPGAHGFHPHLDTFLSGSGGGNCGEPGNAACSWMSPVHPFQPYAQGLVWLVGTAVVVALEWKERRSRQIYYLGAWFFAAIATLAKGPAGFGLPVLCALTYIATTRRWSVLLDVKPVSGLLILAVVALPWYVAAYVRHGTAFTDELLFNDMINRAFSHVHDTNEGADTSVVYYVSQLGYGLFPWTGLVPLGFWWWMRSSAAGDRKRDASVLLFAWFLFAFALFTLMGTKFHHYIFPAVPPAAMLLGVALDGALEELGARRSAHESRIVGAVAVAGALLIALLGKDLAFRQPGEQDGAIRFAQLFSYQYHRPWPSMVDFHGALAAFGAAAAIVVLALAVRALRGRAVAATFAVAGAFAVWCGDVYLSETGRHWGQGDVMRAYYASRASEAETLVAYEMNWKGENFYTGNRLAEFVSGGAPLTKWVEEQKGKGQKVLYFVSERSRVGGLKQTVAAKEWRQVTTKDDSHQFVLMRAVL